MAPLLYTITSFSPSSAYSCATYRADFSTKYGICQTLHNEPDPQILDLSSVSIGGVGLGDIISGLFLSLCVVGLLLVLKWAMDYSVKRRRLGWGYGGWSLIGWRLGRRLEAKR